MKVIIIGAGFTGVQLAKKLVAEGTQVALFDNNQDVTDSLVDLTNVEVECCDGNDLEVLEEKGIANAYALVTVTESDEINIMTCSMVDAVYPNVIKIARVRNYNYYVNSKKIVTEHSAVFAQNKRPLYGIDHMINPDVEAAQAIVTAVEHGVSDVMPLGDSLYELTTIKINQGSKIDGITLKSINTIIDKKITVVFVEKEEETILPTGNTVLNAGDSIGVLTHKDYLNEVKAICGEENDKIRNVVLVGIGRIGTLVVEKLFGEAAESEKHTSLISRIFGKKNNSIKKDFQSFKVVDSNAANIKTFEAKKPEHVLLYPKDITDENFIQQEQLDNSDLCICATHNHELNLMVASYLETLGVKKTIALITNSAFSAIAERMGVDVAVPIRDTVVDSIMSHLRGKNIKEVHTVSTGEYEIIECDISKNSPVEGKTLMEVAMPGKFVMLLIKKQNSDNYELVNGKTVLNENDHIILIQKSGDKTILELISGKK